MMHWLAKTVADHRLVGWLFVILLGVPPILGFAGLRIAGEVREEWIDTETVEKFQDNLKTFRFRAPLVVVVKSPNRLTGPQVLEAATVVRRLKDLDGVERVIWAGGVPEARLTGVLSPILDGLPLDDQRPLPEELRQDAVDQALLDWVKHPLIGESLISADQKSLLLLIVPPVETLAPDVLPQVRRVVDRQSSVSDLEYSVTGAMALRDVHDRALEEDHISIQLTAYGLTWLLCVVIFRRPAAIVVAGTGPVFGVVWTLGWLRLIGQSHNELAIIILPVMVMMIGFTDGVHMVVRIRQLVSQGTTTRDAVYDAVIAVGPACFLTSLTTAIGFGSLVFSQSEMVSGFGRVSAIGVVLTFFSVVLLTPLLANSPLGRHMHVGERKDYLQILMKRCSGLTHSVSRFAAVVAPFGVVVTVACLYFAFQLTPDDRLVDRVPVSCEERTALLFCDENFGGVRYLRASISWTEDVSTGKLWNAIQDIQTLLSEEPLIGRSTSARTLLSVFTVPKAQDRFVLARRLPDDLKEQFYRPDIRQSLVVARLKDRGIAAYQDVFPRIRVAFAKISAQYPGVEVQFLSDLETEGNVIRKMIEELMGSLIVAALLIFVVLTIAFRSLRYGLISVLPNMMPLAAAGALRFWLSDSLEIASACSFAICLGIAVDDTIHFLIHFRQSRESHQSPLQANQSTFETVGSALMMTTLVMSTGLAVVMTSQLPTHVNFAAMGCTTLLAALVADLIFLPALLVLFAGKTAHEKTCDARTSQATDLSAE